MSVPAAADQLARDTVLIVDDEEPVRRTFREWLEEAGLGVEVLAAADAETALTLANSRTIDLAILDWNLGAGNDGLQLLEDLVVFNPDIVAILITGYAHQATPLDAMRMGVRDYLDKNQDLDRNSFLRAVQRQLERVRPLKRERFLQRRLAAFREAVAQALPLVEATAALADPTSPPETVASLFRFVLRATRASDGVLLARTHDPARQPAEICRAYDASGVPLAVPLVPFARSLAGAVAGMSQPCLLELTGPLPLAVELQEFERGRRCLLAAPLSSGPEGQVVLELFDKEGQASFNDEDRRLVAAAADFGGEVLRHALGQRHSHSVLRDAIATALQASESLTRTLEGPQPLSPEPGLLRQIEEGFQDRLRDASQGVRLAEAIRQLSARHGEPAIAHCLTLVESLTRLLDSLAGSEGTRP